MTFDEIAPGTEEAQADDYEAGVEQSEQHALFLPQSKEQETYDLGIEFNMHVQHIDDVEMRAHRMPDEMFHEKFQSLNVKQCEFFTHVLQWLKTRNDPLCVFLTGGAGIGKSVVIQLLYQALNRYYGSQVGDSPDKLRILLCAPTGKGRLITVVAPPFTLLSRSSRTKSTIKNRCPPPR